MRTKDIKDAVNNAHQHQENQCAEMTNKTPANITQSILK